MIAFALWYWDLDRGGAAAVRQGLVPNQRFLFPEMSNPGHMVPGREPGTHVFRDLDEHPGDEEYPGVVVLRLDGGLFFATSDALEDRVREVALSMPGITGIVLDCEGIDFIDSQGSAKMREIHELPGQADMTLRLARVKPSVHELLARGGILGRLGEETSTEMSITR